VAPANVGADDQPPSRWPCVKCCPRKPKASPPLAQNVEIVKPASQHPHMLVLTDAGEEVDDEAALWMLNQHLHSNKDLYADVVFVTGNPAKRAMRWARMKNQCGGSKDHHDRMQFFLGPTTGRDMRYSLSLDIDELKTAGISKLNNFAGGAYDVVLQISPVEGFSEDFENPPNNVSGALARVERRPGCEAPVYVVVGQEGSTNFPLDAVHITWKKSLLQQGFVPLHIDRLNYLNWQCDFLEILPYTLVEMVLDDEWNKAVGRIPPHAVTLFVRFRVNCLINYDVVDKAFVAMERTYFRDANFLKATEWWAGVAEEVHSMVMEGYVQKSRDQDAAKGEKGFGNPPVSNTVKGMNFTWSSITSRKLIRDAVAADPGLEAGLPNLSVDEVLCWAVTLMTGKLLRIYAFDAFAAGKQPSKAQFQPYLMGNGNTPPLDWHTYPQLLGDHTAVQREVVGNPMYDPAGMLVALLLCCAKPEEVRGFAGRLQEPSALLDADARGRAMRACFAGEEAPRSFVARFAAPPGGAPAVAKAPGAASPKPEGEAGSESFEPRMLFFTNAGESGNNEAALWLLHQYLSTAKKGRADVVFVTGNPLQRAMCWARILNSVGGSGAGSPGGAAERMNYYLGPDTGVPMNINLTAEELKAAGMGKITEREFDGGLYDIVVQGSPLGGFDSNFREPCQSVEGALSRISARRSGRVPLYMVFGDEGATNFPRDPLHIGFKQHLSGSGFFAVHIGRRYIINWNRSYFDSIPPKLSSIIMESSWDKVVGRVSPTSATLLVRFRLNTCDNYKAVNHVYMTYKTISKNDTDSRKASEWWRNQDEGVSNAVAGGYVKSSRDNDASRDACSFGNPRISELVKDMSFTWESEVARELRSDLATVHGMTDETISAMTVDDVMCRAVTLMTSKLMQIYAYNVFAAQGEPNNQQCMTYVQGTEAVKPLDSFLFPRLFGDLYEYQKEVGNFPMYGASGMILALVAMAAPPQQVGVLTKKMHEQAVLLDEEQTGKAIKGVWTGSGPKKLLQKFFGNGQETTPYSELRIV